MKKVISLIIIVSLNSFSVLSQDMENDENLRLEALNNYWAEVSRAVNKGDFEAYSATCHRKATLVAGIGKKAYPLSKALVRWKKEFDDTKAGMRKSSVEFRFSQRLGDKDAAHETGIFLYSFEQDGKKGSDYINFEALLVKEGTWKIMMEYQKSSATKEEWDKLKVL
jgi:hypothetical protein